MEEELTVEELFAIEESMFETQHSRNRFAAALQGVDLDEDKDDTFDRIAQKAAADLAGKDEDEYVLNMIGIEFEEDDED